MPKFKTLFPEAKILVVDDEPELLFSVSTALENAGFRHIVTLADSRKALETLEGDEFSCVLLDLWMPDLSGKTLLPLLVERFPNVSVVVVTADTNLETAVSCLRQGACDYLTKPIDKTRLLSTVEKAIQSKKLHDENLNLKRGLLGVALQHSKAFEEIVTDHPAMKSLFAYMEAVAGSVNPILITGESGTGKELVAASLHKLSGRSGEFVTINVAGLDDALFSDTLFGHTKGAFTSAHQERVGLVGKAEDGVLFLDEIGSLEMASQVKLLRLMQEREFHPLGSDKVCQTNTRFILATNLDLEKAVEDGVFREDLYYRLKTHSIQIPPLRERLSDLPHLLKHFIHKHAKLMNKRTTGYPPQLPELMNHYHFPGNVRELESIVVDAVARSNNNIIPLEPFMNAMDYKRPSPEEIKVSLDNTYAGPEAVPTLKEMEAAHIDNVLRLTNDNLTAAAKLLGMNYTSLYRRLKRAGAAKKKSA